MRVLVASTPGTGHILPMVPLVAALGASGHELLWATGRDGHDLLRRFDIEAVPSGLEGEARNARFRAEGPDIRSLPPRERRGVQFPGLFARLSVGPMFDDLVAIATDFEPDLVLHEPCELASRPVAQMVGAPAVTVGFGRFLPAPLVDAAAEEDELARVWAAAGGEPPAGLGHYESMYLHPLPPSLEPVPPDRPTVSLLRPVAPGPGPSPAPVTRGARPRLYVTFGTEFGPMAPWTAVIEALAACEVDALFTLGAAVDPASLGPLPAGVRAERWVPQQEALTGADLLISHGGSGAMLGAAATGIPHLVLPIAADQFENADAVGRLPCGAVLDPLEATAEDIAAAVTTLLSDPLAARSATALAVEIADLPAPESVVHGLEALVTA